MSHADDEALAELAISGPTTADVDPAVRDHVAGCESCSAEVADLRRTLALTSRTRPSEPWYAPGPDVWSRITDEIDHPTGDAHTEPEAATPDPSATGPRATVRAGEAAEVSTEAGETSRTPIELRRTRRERQDRAGAGRSRLIGWAAGLAAAGLVIGLFTGRLLWSEPGRTPTTVSQVALDTLNKTDPQKLGEATIVRTNGNYALTVDTTKPLKAGDGYLEVWLINRDLKRMVSVGVLSGEGPASFPISSTLIDQGYVVVDISREQFDDNPAHSGDSIVRGKLPA